MTSQQETELALQSIENGLWLEPTREKTLEPEVLDVNPLLSSGEVFARVSKVAEIFAGTNIVPQHFRGAKGSPGHANCFLAISMAMELGVSWLAALQNLHIVHGNIGFSGQFYVALANQRAPIKGRIAYREGGEGDEQFCEAYAVDRRSNQELSYRMTIAEVKQTKWYARNPLWKEQAKLMLRYRTAAYLVRTNFPESMMGLHTVEELRDVHGSETSQAKGVAESLLEEAQE